MLPILICKTKLSFGFGVPSFIYQCKRITDSNSNQVHFTKHRYKTNALSCSLMAVSFSFLNRKSFIRSALLMTSGRQSFNKRSENQCVILRHFTGVFIFYYGLEFKRCQKKFILILVILRGCAFHMRHVDINL